MKEHGVLLNADEPRVCGRVPRVGEEPFEFEMEKRLKI
jgi:hypothetical protein